MDERPVRQWNGLTIPDPGVYRLDEAHKRIGFHATHMMVSPVRGEFTEARATVTITEDPLQSSVEATIAAASITTNNDERDTHLRSPDFLDVGTFPTLEYRSTGVKWLGGNDDIFSWVRLRQNPISRRGAAPPVPANLPDQARRFVLTGDLTVRSVTQQVEMSMEFGGARRDPYGRDIFGFSATAEFERESFGLVWNVALETGGFLVGKRVKLEIAGEAIRQ